MVFVGHENVSNGFLAKIKKLKRIIGNRKFIEIIESIEIDFSCKFII